MQGFSNFRLQTKALHLYPRSNSLNCDQLKCVCVCVCVCVLCCVCVCVCVCVCFMLCVCVCVCVCVQKWIKQFLHTSTSTLHVYHGGFMVGETAPVPKQKQIDTKMDKNSFRTHTHQQAHTLYVSLWSTVVKTAVMPKVKKKLGQQCKKQFFTYAHKLAHVHLLHVNHGGVTVIEN